MAPPAPVQDTHASEAMQPPTALPTETAPPQANTPEPVANPERRVVKKGVSTKKKESIDVHAVLADLHFLITPTEEKSLLALTAQGTTVETVVLLEQNDRAALFSWLESPDVKTIFSVLKQSLQEHFSPQLKDLIDEVRTEEGGPPVNVLSFIDPAISPESVIIIRVRNRLYEFHVAERSADAIHQLIGALSK